MGYSHYWSHTREFTVPEWKKVKDVANALAKICGQHGVHLVGVEGDQRSRHVIDNEQVAFNGVPGCEGFLLERSPPAYIRERKKRRREMMGEPDDGTICFSFCKTRALPYDIAVVAMLAAVDMIVPGALQLSSDGDPETDLAKGIELARRLLSELFPGETFTCSLEAPRKMLEA